MSSIKITDSKSLASVQKDFHEAFPFLKLEFFHKRHNAMQGSYKKDILNSDITLKQCRKKHTEGTIILKENMKVKELENIFQEHFGLFAQVFRKMGRSWIETTITDDWTLKQQNDEGKELSFLSR
ncbi:MAG: hypothetical protein ACXVC6_13055 [Bacteroidia bacterium]